MENKIPSRIEPDTLSSVNRKSEGTGESAYIRQSLEDLIYPFEILARRAVESILFSSSRSLGNFKICSTLTLEASTSCVIQSENGEFTSTVFLCMNSIDLPRLFSNPSGLTEQWDVISEINNTLAGNFLGNTKFYARFLGMNPSLPCFTTEKIEFFNAYCIHGHLVVKEVEMHFGFMIKPKDWASSPS